MHEPQPYSSSPTRHSALADIRPGSPGQLALIGLGVWLVGVFIHSLAILVPIGLGLLLVAGLGQLVRPRSRTTYWRGRQIDLGDEPSVVARLYRLVFKR
jgi:hypothetical protein